MKIGTRLTIRYAGITAIVFLVLTLVIFFVSESNRKTAFFHDLKKEAITKANLFLDNRVDPEIMQSIYLNNRELLDEVEVAVYDTQFNLLYHDAKQIDFVKETPIMMDEILQQGEIQFVQDKYEVIGLLYSYKGEEYLITAAAYDGYGYAKQESLRNMLILLYLLGLGILIGVGYILSRSALAPVTAIVNEVEAISASRLNMRVPVVDPNDELGELSLTFNQMLDRLEKSFTAQRMFVSNISHELRTPLAALITELELALLKERSNKEYREAIDNALLDTKKIVRLSEGILNLAKTDYLPEQIKKKEVRLDELLLDARELVLKANPNYVVELNFEQLSDDDSLITVLGNSYLLKTAFVNLIENNCKFSENHTSFIQIAFGTKNAIVSFSDEGIGMSPEDVTHIFSPFYRGGNKSYAQGNGIGMTLTKKILDIHKGEIVVKSVLNHGTRYTVTIPHI